MAENLEIKPLTIKQVPTGNAWAWIMNGFNLFKANPAMWIILLVIYLAIMIPVSMLPVVGSVLSTLLAPVFAAGMMWGCQALVQNQDLEINHLFEGFKHNTSQLVTIGGIYMVSLLFVAVIVVMALDKETVELLLAGKDLSQEQADGMLLPILIALMLMMPVLMAYWFAPVLAGLHNLKAVDAMKLSLIACLKNVMPFLLYGFLFMLILIVEMWLIVGVSAFFATLLLVSIPLMMTSLYTSYADIFNIS